MYGIPKELNLRDIVGSEIQQICIGRYDVQFRFGSGRSINVQSDVQILRNQHVIAEWNDSKGWSTTAFHELLNARVTGYAVAHEKLLEVSFEGFLLLKLHDNSDQYESMQIYPEGIVV